MRSRRRLVAAGGLAAVALAAGAGPSPAATLEPIAPGAHPTAATVAPAVGYRDRVITAPPRALTSAVTQRSATGLYRAPDGRVVEVTTSGSFADTPETRAAAQSFVDFLGSRLHGAELSRLRVFIGTNPEINALCGGGRGVLGCYASAASRMLIPASDPPGGGAFTREYVLTHEYGHHIARHRSNFPFPALNYGPKYWASHEYVCDNAYRGRLAPGNQGARYLDDPGEGFADAYAHLHYPGVPWQFAGILFPNAGSFAAIRRDVLAPWVTQRRGALRGYAGRFTRSRSYVVPVTLDGILQLRLIGPARSNLDLEIVSRGRVLVRSSVPGSRDTLAIRVCRAGLPVVRPVVRVVRRTGGGVFTLLTARPG